MAKPCSVCASPDHTQFYCRLKPRTPLPRATKPIKTNVLPRPIGKQGKRTNVAVARWKREQQPNDNGYYECYICHKWVTYLEAEHVKSKARHPELRTDPNNLRPVCSECNRIKGSNDND